MPVDTAREDPFGLVGTTLDQRFRIEREIAEGGFGVVYFATQVALDRPVAIKVLKSPAGLDQAARTDFQSRFADEAKTIARLRHPHIVDVYDFGVSRLRSGDVVPWMALEWLEGHTLEEQLTRRRGQGGRPPSEVLTILRPVLQALAFAHTQGIVHRDIKPANIMAVPSSDGPIIRVLDFGISKVVRPDEAAGSGHTRTAGLTAFSPLYAAPEQIAFGRTGPWTDVHALGLLLTEFLTDEPPYRASDMQLFEEVIARSRPTPGKWGVEVGAWEAVIQRAVALSPSERWTSASELLSALEVTLGQSHHREAPHTASSSARTTYEAHTDPQRPTWSSSTTGSANWRGRSRHREDPHTARPSAGTTYDAPANPQRTAWTSPTTDAANWLDISSALPLGLRSSAAAIIELLRSWFHGVEIVDGNVVRLTGPRPSELTEHACFAIFLGADLASNDGVGTQTFVSYARPLDTHLASLTPDVRKLVIVITDSYALGKGARQKIAEYQETYRAAVVPVYLGEVLKASRDGRIDTLLSDRLFDLHSRPNLFSRRGRTLDPTRIVGIEGAVNDLVKELSQPGTAVLIAGSPGSGKTVLIGMAEFGLDTVAFKRLDCHDLFPPTAATVAYEIAKVLGRTPAPDGDVMSVMAAAIESPNDADTAQPRAILVLEDADWLVEFSAREADTSAPIRGFWTILARACRAGTLSIVITGCSVGLLARRRLGQWFNPLASVARQYPVRPLSWRAANRLITELAIGCNLQVRDSASLEIFRWSGGNADILMRICSAIVNDQRAREDEHPLAIVSVSNSAVRRSIDGMMADDAAFQGSGVDLLDALDSRVLRAIGVHRPRSTRRLQILLEDVDPPLVSNSVERLTRTGFISRRRSRLSPAIPLLERWLERDVNARAGEAARLRARQLSWGVLALGTALLTGSAWYVSRPNGPRNSGELTVSGCRFDISCPSRLSPGDTLTVTLIAERCETPFSGVETVHVVPTSGMPFQGLSGGILDVPVRCISHTCVGTASATLDKIGDSVELEVASNSKDATHVSIHHDPFRAAKAGVTMSLQYGSAMLAVVGLWLTFNRRLSRLVTGVWRFLRGDSTELPNTPGRQE